MINKNEKLGIVAALIANLLFGFSNYFSAIALRHAPPLVILSIRFTLAFLILSLLWALKIIKLKYRGKKKGILILMCIAQPLVYFYCELYGIEMTSSSLSGVMISLVPVAAILLSVIFLRERPKFLQLLFMAISLFGVILINVFADDVGSVQTKGIILLVGAIIAAAVFNVLSKRLSKGFSPIERTYFMFVIGSIGFNLIAIGKYGVSFFPMVVSAFSSVEFIYSILYLSVGSSILAYFLYNYSTSKISIVKASSFANIIPIAAILAGVFILGEPFNFIQAICSVLIILGVCGVNVLHTGKK